MRTLSDPNPSGGALWIMDFLIAFNDGEESPSADYKPNFTKTIVNK
jgi:hypothetical protein